MTVLINQFILAFWNFINSRIDAYRIIRNKSIAHGINFCIYAAITLALILLFKMNSFGDILLFCISAFCNRQLSFDIPLNLRRGLPWYYQSAANPPKAMWDRIEKWFFGIDYDGKKIAAYYLCLFIFSTIVELYGNSNS